MYVVTEPSLTVGIDNKDSAILKTYSRALITAEKHFSIYIKVFDLHTILVMYQISVLGGSQSQI